MDCSAFIERFTEYLDGSPSSEDLRAMEAHLARCDSCRRYRKVLEDGSSLLRSLPKPELREDFAPRLQHRLYHVQDERTLAEHATSGAPALTVLGVAILLAAVAWAPMLRGSAPVVRLQPIVVDQAPAQLPALPPASPGTRAGISGDLGLREVDLWGDARLYEYSSLRQRYEGPRRMGYSTDR